MFETCFSVNYMCTFHHKQYTSCVASFMESTNLSMSQQVFELMRLMLTKSEIAGNYFTNDLIKALTRKVRSQVD